MPINDPRLRPQIDKLPDSVREAFRDRPLIPFREMAKLLRISHHNLDRIVQDRQIPYRKLGIGKKSPRRAFAVDDAAVLWHSMVCQLAD